MKIFLYFLRTARFALIGCLVATALALSVVRFWLLPRASEWREELQANIGSMLGETVHIKSLSAGMRGFKPELMMRGLRIENADGLPAVEFERVGVGLDVSKSLLEKTPVINRIELEGTRLRLLTTAEGKLAVAGLKPGGSPLWLFADGEVRFADIDLEWADGNGAPPLFLGRVQARLSNGGGRHVADVRLDLPGKLGKSLRWSADIQGNPLQAAGWSARAYLEAKRLREGAFIDSLPVRLRSGELSFQAWAQWRDGVFNEAVTKLDFDRPMVVWRGLGDKPEGMFGLDKLAGWLHWRKEDQGWRLDAKHFALAQNGKSWPETDLAFALSQEPDGSLRKLRAAFSFLRVDEAIALLGSLPVLDAQIQEAAKSIALRGELRSAHLVYEAEGRLGFCGQLLGISFNPPAGWPGFNRFSGHVCGNDRNGRAVLDLLKSDLSLPGLLAKPLPIDRLGGRLTWSRSGPNLILPKLPEPKPVEKPPIPEAELVGPPLPEEMALARAQAAAPPPPPPAPEPAPPAYQPFPGSSWRLAGNQIKVAAPGLQVEGGFALDLPAEGAGSPEVDLKLGVRDVDVARLNDYLPLPAMSAAAAKWHGEAYRGGKITQAEVELRGRLADFPFPQGEGLFEAHVDMESIELNFNPQWPHLFGVNAKALFFGPAMFVDTEGGRIGDIPLKTIHAEAATFSGDAYVGIGGDLDIELGSALKFLQQTPVRHIPQRLAKAVEAAGEAHLDLKLQVPVGAGDTGVEGLLQLKNDTLSIKGANLKITELNGGLNFTEAGLEGKLILGKALDEPVFIDVAQDDNEILIDVGGKAGVPALSRAFPSELWRLAEGAATYHLAVQMAKNLDASSKPLRLNLDTDLVGLGLQLPAPLEKEPAIKKDLSVNLSLRRGDSSSIRLSYGREGLARLMFSSGDGYKLESGDVFWDKPQTPADWSPGLGLYLKLEELDIGAWRKLLGAFNAGTETLVPHGLDVQVKYLSWDGEDYGSLNLTGRHDYGDLVGEVDCKYGKGSYLVSAPEFSNPSLRLELDYLHLPKLPDEKEGQPSTSPDPAQLPALQVHARHLYRLGADLGELNLDAEHWTSGLNIRRLTLNTNNHDLSLRGSWMRQEGHDETRLDGKLKVHDLGLLLTQLGYGKEIQYTPTESMFSLTWNGAPQQFSAATLSGEVRLKLGRGSVLQMDPGLGRALGMLNLQTLRRLLLLDFNDLFGKGLAFDGMEGSFTLENGQARTRGFVIDAVAADILLIGRVGLADHDFDQTISVMPHAVASIPLAAPLLGGAAVGAVINMAQRLVGAEDSNIASTNYSVTGTWDNPQFKRIQGSIPLDMINRAWSGIKDLSGMGGEGRPE